MRLQALERDGWACQNCEDTESTLHVHHLYYTKGAEPWDYPLEAFLTLCVNCHESETEQRSLYEQSFLAQLREKGYLAGDILDLDHLTYHIPTPDHGGTLFRALYHKITQPGFIDSVITEYHEYRKERAQAFEKAKASLNEPSEAHE